MTPPDATPTERWSRANGGIERRATPREPVLLPALLVNVLLQPHSLAQLQAAPLLAWGNVALLACSARLWPMCCISV